VAGDALRKLLQGILRKAAAGLVCGGKDAVYAKGVQPLLDLFEAHILPSFAVFIVAHGG
jgi:hypothetical protein